MLASGPVEPKAALPSRSRGSTIHICLIMEEAEASGRNLSQDAFILTCLALGRL